MLKIIVITIISLLIPSLSYCYSTTKIVKAMQYSSKEFKVPMRLIYGVIREESDFNINARSPKGAIGLMQLMPVTAKFLGVNPYDPVENIIGGVAYLRYCLNEFNNSYFYALTCYNAGPGNVYRGYVSYNYIQNIVNFAERANQ